MLGRGGTHPYVGKMPTEKITTNLLGKLFYMGGTKVQAVKKGCFVKKKEPLLILKTIKVLSGIRLRKRYFLSGKGGHGHRFG